MLLLFSELIISIELKIELFIKLTKINVKNIKELLTISQREEHSKPIEKWANKWTGIPESRKHIERDVLQLLNHDYNYPAFYLQSMGKN